MFNVLFCTEERKGAWKGVRELRGKERKRKRGKRLENLEREKKRVQAVERSICGLN